MKLLVTLLFLFVAGFILAQKDTIYSKSTSPMVGKVEKIEKKIVYIQREFSQKGVLYPMKKKQITHIVYADGRIEYYNPIEEEVSLPEREIESKESVENQENIELTEKTPLLLQKKLKKPRKGLRKTL